MVRVLSDSEVEALVSFDELLRAVSEAFKSLSANEIAMPPRGKVTVEGRGDLLLMPCLAPSLGIFTLKVISIYPRNPERGLPTTSAVIMAFDPDDGVPKLVAEARALTALRTAAATALSIKYLARPESSNLGLIGCGYQARWQLLLANHVMRPEGIKVYDVLKERAESLAQEALRRTGKSVEVCTSARELVEDSDVVITATTSRSPVVKKEWVNPGTHIAAIGSYLPEVAELDPQLVASAKVVVDHIEAAKEEAGDIIQAVRLGLMRWEDIYGEIGEIIAGLKPGRLSDDEVTVFKTVGTAAQDAAVASILLSKTATR